MDFEKCTAVTNDQIVVLRENRSKFVFNNRDRIPVSKVQVDGCLINNDNEKCDWILSIESLKRALFIELKGSDIDKAISQLKSTLRLTKSQFKGYDRECYVVTTRIPKHGPSVRRKSMAFFKETKSTLSVKNLQAKVNC